MKLNKLSLLVLSISLFLCFADFGLAQTKSAPSAVPPTSQAPPTTETKKPAAGPFHGKLAAVDLAARTIKVGKRTFYVTAETKMKKEGKPARLEDSVVGEPCSGYVRPDEAGRLIAKSVNFGPKPEADSNSSKIKSKKTAE